MTTFRGGGVKGAVVVTLTLAMGAAGLALAQSTSWMVGAGNWGDAGNWSAGVPIGTTNAFLNNDTAGTTTANGTVDAANELVLGGGAGERVLKIGNNNAFTVNGTLTINGNGTFWLPALGNPLTITLSAVSNRGLFDDDNIGTNSSFDITIAGSGAFVNESGGTVLLNNGRSNDVRFDMPVTNKGAWNNTGTNVRTFYQDTFTNEGTLTFGGNTPHAFSGALTNTSTGVIDANGNGTVSLPTTGTSLNAGTIYLKRGGLGSGGVLENSGTIYGMGGGLSAQFTNVGDGKIISTTGTTTLSQAGGNFYRGGTIEVQAGAGVTLSGNTPAVPGETLGWTMSTAVTNHGTWTSHSSGNGFRYDSGTAFENKAGATFYHSGSSGIRVYDDFNNHGTATIATGNTMTMFDGATFTNFSGGTLNFSNTGFAGPLVNHGVVNTPLGSSLINSPFVNEVGGAWTVTGVQRQNAGSTEAAPMINRGSMLVDTGGTLRFEQSQASYENTGTLTVRGAVTESAYAREYLKNLDGGTIVMDGGSFSAGSAQYQAGSTLEGHGTFGTHDYPQTSAVTNHGTVIASGGTLTAAGWGAYTFGNTSMLEVKPDATMAFELTVPTNTVTLQGGSTLQVAGTLALPAGNLRIDMPPENANWRDGLLALGDGTARTQSLEVGGLDLGTEDIVFDIGNFNLGGLMLLDNTTLNLTDLAANQPGDDSLYVRRLTVGDGVTINLNGYKLYYGMLFGDPTVLGYGVFEQFHVPEPGSLALLALASLLTLRRRRR